MSDAKALIDQLDDFGSKMQKDYERKPNSFFGPLSDSPTKTNPPPGRIMDILEDDSTKRWLENQDDFQNGVDKLRFAEEVNRHLGVDMKDTLHNFDEVAERITGSADPQGALESIGKAAEVGNKIVELAQYTSDYMYFGKGDIETIREMAASMPRVDKDQGPITRILQAVMENAPLQIVSRLRGATFGLLSGMGTAGMALKSTGVMFTPSPLDDVLSAGGAFAMTFTPVYKTMTAVDMAKMQAGLEFANLMSMQGTNEDGEPVYMNEGVAKALATGVGGLNGIIEFMQTGTLLKGFSGLKGKLGRSVADAMHRATTSNRFVGFVSNFIRNYPKTIGIEVIQELSQESISIAGEELAKVLSGKRERTYDDVVEDLKGHADAEVREMAERGIDREIVNYISSHGGHEAFGIGEKIQPIFPQTTVDEIMNRFKTTAIETFYYTLAAALPGSVAISSRRSAAARSDIRQRIKTIVESNPQSTYEELMQAVQDDPELQKYNKRRVAKETLDQYKGETKKLLNTLEAKELGEREVEPEDPALKELWRKANEKKLEEVRMTEEILNEVKEDIERERVHYREEMIRRFEQELTEEEQKKRAESEEQGEKVMKIGQPGLPDWFKKQLIQEKVEELLRKRAEQYSRKDTLGEEKLSPEQFRSYASQRQEDFSNAISAIEEFYETNKKKMSPAAREEVLTSILDLRKEDLRARQEMDLPRDPSDLQKYYHDRIDEAQKQLQQLEEVEGPSVEQQKEIQILKQQIREDRRTIQRTEKLFKVADINMEKSVQLARDIEGRTAQVKELQAQIEYLETEGRERTLRDIYTDFAYAQDTRKKSSETLSQYLKRIESMKKEVSETQQKINEELLKFSQEAIDQITRPPKGIDYRFSRMIEDIQAAIDPNLMEGDQARRLENLKLAYAGTEMSGQADEIINIAQKPVDQWTIKDLTKMRSHVNMLRVLGRQEVARRAEIREDQINSAKERAREATKYKDLSNVPKTSAAYDKLSNPGKLPEVFRKVLSHIMPPDKWSDLLDGGDATYDGPNFKTFYSDLQSAKAKHLRMKQVRMKHIHEEITKLGLKLRDFYKPREIAPNISFEVGQIMGLYIAQRNSKVFEKILERNNLTEKVVDEAVATLTDAEKEAAEIFALDLRRVYPRLRRAKLNLTGVDMGYVDWYFPFKDQNYTYKSYEEELSEQLEKGDRERKEVDERMTKRRKEGNMEVGLRIDLPLLWMETVPQQEYYIQMADPLVTARRLASDPEFSSMVRQKFGDSWNKMIDDYLSYQANPKMNRSFTPWENLNLMLQRNMARMWLWMNPTTMPKQFPSALNYMGFSGPKHFFAALDDFVKHPFSLHKIITELDPSMKDRGIYQELENMKKYNKKAWRRLYNKFGEAGMIGISLVDKMATNIGWWAIYNKTLEETGDTELAIARARDVTFQTQPSRDPAVLPEIYRNHTMLRWFTIFTQQPTKNFFLATYDIPRNIRHAIKQPKSHHWGRAALIAGALGTSAMMLYAIDNKRLPEEESEWLDMGAKYFFQQAPMVGKKIISFSEGYWDNSLPLFKPVEAAVNITKDIQKGKISEWTAWNTIEAVSMFTAYPFGITKKAYKALENDDIIELFGGMPED